MDLKSDFMSVQITRMPALPFPMTTTLYGYAGFLKDIELLFEQLTIRHAGEGSCLFFIADCPCSSQHPLLDIINYHLKRIQLHHLKPTLSVISAEFAANLVNAIMTQMINPLYYC